MRKTKLVMTLGTLALATALVGCSANQNTQSQQTTQSSKQPTREEILVQKKEKWKELILEEYNSNLRKEKIDDEKYKARKQNTIKFLDFIKNTDGLEFLYDEEKYIEIAENQASEFDRKQKEKYGGSFSEVAKRLWGKDFREKFGFYSSTEYKNEDATYRMAEGLRELKELLDYGYTYSEEYVIPALSDIDGSYEAGVKVLFEKDGEFAETEIHTGDVIPGEGAPVLINIAESRIEYLTW